MIELIYIYFLMTMFEILCIDDVSESEYEKYYSLLAEEKKKRIDSFRFEKDKRLSVLAEMLAKKMIARHCSIAPEDITIRSDENGKPYALKSDTEFNISHSGNMVACALSDRPVGIDIQKMRHIDDKIIRYVCCADELDYILSKEELKQRRFFEVWTAKEAYFKCIGTGITDLKSISIFDDEIKNNLKTHFEKDYAISVYEQNK